MILYAELLLRHVTHFPRLLTRVRTICDPQTTGASRVKKLSVQSTKMGSIGRNEVPFINEFLNVLQTNNIRYCNTWSATKKCL